jgi:hypothetical protein
MTRQLLLACLSLVPFSLFSHPIGDFIHYIPSDVYSVKQYEYLSNGVKVKIYDWYENTNHTYFCSYNNDWCFPKFYPTLAVRYGECLD